MTTFVILGFLLLVEVPAFLWRLTWGEGLARTTVHMMAFVIVCQIVFFLYAVAVFADPGSPCAYDSALTIPAKGLTILAVLFAIFAAVDLLCPRAQGVWVNSRIALASLLEQTARFLPFVAAFALVYLVAYLATRDLGVLWSNSTYLLMASKLGATSEGAFPTVLGSMLTPTFFLACMFLAVALAVGRKVETMALLLSTTMMFVLETSGSSRPGAVGILLFCLTYALLRRRIGAGIIVLVIFAIYTFQAVLIGRGMGAFGVANFWTVLSYPLTEGLNFETLFKNLFQGAVSTPDGLLVAGNFSDRYRWLSFSPLPSFVDGFDQIRASDQISLHTFCPMSAVTEVIRFGPLFWVVMIVEYAAMAIIVNSRFATSRAGLLPVLCVNLLLTVFTITGFTYPLRNVLRPMVYACIALVLFAFFSKRPLTFQRADQPSPRPGASPGRYFVRPRRTRR